MKKILFILTVTLSFNSNAQTTVCQGDTVVLIVDNPAGTIQWQQSSDQITWNNIAGAANDSLQVQALTELFYRALIHDASCSLPINYYSDTLNFTIINFLPVSVIISASPSTTICSATNVMFSATPINGGTIPAYQWKKNGTNISGATSSTYSTSTIANNDAISCVLTSNYQCPTGNPATSNTIAMTVNNNLPVSVSIAASPGITICTGSNVTFTANLINGGNNPQYQWKKNGTNISGATNLTYNTSSLVNNDSITCQITSNISCPSGNPATSNVLVMNVISSTCGTVTDIDGNVYNTVVIGTQCWMLENLKTTRFRNGVTIPNVTDSAGWLNPQAAYCNYNNDPNNSMIYGRLYNFYAVSDSNNLAPVGWHVPSQAELITLQTYLGGNNVAGGKLKESDTTHWQSPNTGANNESDFTALPGGRRTSVFSFIGISCYLWSNTPADLNAIAGRLSYLETYFPIGAWGKGAGFSVRCLKGLGVGENYGGGIVAYILQPGDPGYVAGETHGIIAAPFDQSAGVQWGCSGTIIGTATGIGTGQANTASIVNGCSTTGIAARLCNDLVLNGYSDWYLPSQNELNKLYLNRIAIGGFSNIGYWSSTETDSNLAKAQNFSTGNIGNNTKSSIYYVRAVRAF